MKQLLAPVKRKIKSKMVEQLESEMKEKSLSNSSKSREPSNHTHD